MKKVREGYKMTELGEIPEEWELKKLGDICVLRNEKFNPLEEENSKYIALEHIEQGKGRICGVGNSNETTSMKTKFKKGDILFGKLRPYLRKFWLANFDGVCATEILTLFANGANDKFCFYLIQQDKFIEYTDQSSFGTKMPRTSWNDIKEFLVPLPSKTEQEKISSIIYSVDEQIEITDNLIEKTKELKKGLMKKILTKGIGHARFKDTEVGKIPEEWEVKKLGEILFVIGGYAFQSSKFQTERNENNLQVIRMGNVQMGLLDINRNPVFMNGEEISDKEKEFILKSGDVLISLTGTINKRDYGNIAYVNLNNKYLLNQRVACLRTSNKEYSSKFYYYLFQIEMFRNQFFELGMGGTGNQTNVSISDLKKVNILYIPPEEQQGIASILSSVDDEVDQYESKKEKLLELKKGLMQKLLTGKIRVKV